MNEVERKVRAEFEKILKRDHGMNLEDDRQWITGLWANLDSEDISFACSQLQSGVTDLVADAVESDLYQGYMSFKRGRPPLGSVGTIGHSEKAESIHAVLLGDSDDDEQGWSGGQAPDGKLKDTIRERIAALSVYLSKIVATDVSVIAFRKDVLGDPTKTLAPEGATELLHSLAAEQHPGSPGEAETLWWTGSEENTRAEAITVWPGSQLRKLKKISTRLANRYPWTEEQACYLILTGRPIRAATMRAKTSTNSTGAPAHRYRRATITMEVDSWMPSEYVRRAYHDLQRTLLGENNRQPELRNVVLFRFVVDHSDLQIVNREENLAKLTMPSWKELRELWNERYPQNHEWHYGKDRAHRFSRDFLERGQEAVIGTKWGLPGVPGMPKGEEEVKQGVVNMLENAASKKKAR